MPVLTVRITATGVVQGVGFRPFVFNLASGLKLAGLVRNTGSGAQIVVQGETKNVRRFISKLEKSKFAAKYSCKEIASKKYRSFQIKKSKKSKVLSEFPSDLALCEDCKKELFSKTDRRYKYPFVNCVNCGPRFSIIKKLPYDRKNTIMSKFKMCPACREEYGDPKNRRFHAQPNACPVCGPKLSLFDKNAKLIAEREKAFELAAKLLKRGKILAVKGIGGYHLMCDASNKKTVEFLRKRKNRPYKPFAVMADINTAKRLCEVSRYEEAALKSPAAPIVILERKPNIEIQSISFDDTLGVMLPYAPLHHLLVKEIPVLVATSGNRADEPISAAEKEAFKNLSGIADYFLVHNRDIENRSDDSIVRFFPNASTKKIIIRRSRGYVPNPIATSTADSVIAAGGDLKNNFCVTRNGKAYLSQFIGDLADRPNMDFYSESVQKMKSFLEINPKRAVCDGHPGYASTQHFGGKSLKQSFAFHHYAHMASVIAEHNLKGKVLGFAFDGSGYGEDGNIWGGEVISFDSNKFVRVAHLDYFKLPGGDLCAEEIWRCGVSLLHKYGFDSDIPKLFGKYDWRSAVKMIDAGVNSPETSSMGRVFDGISAILGIKTLATYEAEGAIMLEAAANRTKSAGNYNFEIEDDVIVIKKILKGILSDLNKKMPNGTIAMKFHNTVVEIIDSCCKQYRAKTVVLSGGVFQNMLLLSKTIEKLQKKKIKVYFNEKVPINDGGIALGQLYISKMHSKNGKISKK